MNESDKGPRLNPEFPIKEPSQISPPTVRPPIHACARVVHVFGFVPHALVKVYAHTTEVVGHLTPYVGYADIPLTRELNMGESITATQTISGMESVQSYTPVIVTPMPTTLNKPVVGHDLYDCGQVVPVSGLTASTRVEVFQNATMLTIENPSTLIGQGDAAGDWLPVATSALHANKFVTAQQLACPDRADKLVSPPSNPVQIKPEPNPMHRPDMEPPIIGNDVVNLAQLYVGALLTATDETAGHDVGGGLATAAANWAPVSPPIQSQHLYSATQKLCQLSPSSPKQPATTELLAPIVISPLCAGEQFVTIRRTIVNATVVLFRRGKIAGIGGAVPGDLQLALGGGAKLGFDDEIRAIQYMGSTVSALSNKVYVGDCHNVVTQHNDNSRSGAYLFETQLTPANVNASSFGKLYERTIEGDVCAQPLYVRQVPTAHGSKNLIFIATSTNQVCAFDADDLSKDSNAGVVWQRSLDNWRPLTEVDICNETKGTVGITSTPVIDVHTMTMYVVTRRWTERGDPHDGENFLHALNIADGSERKQSPVKIQGTDPHNDKVRYDSRCQRNRPGLLLLNDVVYVAFGTFSCDADCPDGTHYRGWVMGYRTSDLSQAGVFCTSPDGGGAGVWQSGNGLVGMDDGTIYFETGNDTVPAKLGDSFIKLQATNFVPFLVLAGSFRPNNADTLRDGGKLSASAQSVPGHPSRPGHPDLGSGDTDLGSGGPMLLPGGRLIGGGKQGRFYVLDTDTMHLTQNATPDPDPVIGEGFQAFTNTWTIQYLPHDYALGELYGPNIHGGPIYWEGTGYIYQMPEKDFLKAFKYDQTAKQVHIIPSAVSSVRPPNGMPGGHSSLSANGTNDGIVWTLVPNGNAQSNKVPGTLVAFDARTLKELWRDPGPISFAKFCPPTIADGKVIRPTFASDVNHNPIVPGKVVVYGLLE